MLQRGDLVPHFDATDINAHRVVYAEAVWQRHALVLISLPRHDVSALRLHLSSCDTLLQSTGVRCVVTPDPIPGLPSGGVLVADRWGEIAMVQHLDDHQPLPSAAEIAEWIDFVERQCPECQGEVK